MVLAKPERKFLSPEEWRQADAGARLQLPLQKQLVTEIEVVKAGDQPSRSLKFKVSTETVDRDRDIIALAGWDLSNFKKNPVVLWAHNYWQPPVAKCTSIGIEGNALVAVAEFAKAEDYAFADTVYRLLLGGFLKATSVGFRVLKYVFNEDRRGYDIQEQELLEFSIVPVPANPEAVQLAAKALGFADPGVLEIAFPRGTKFYAPSVAKGIVPADVSTKKAPEDTPWKKPKLSDFGDKTPAQIKGYFAWAASASPENFSDLKLPHHRPSDGAVVWRGVAAAMGALLGARGGVSIPSGDRKKVYAHLAKHYKAFGKDVPEFKEAAYTVAELEAHFRSVGFSKEESLDMAKRSKTGRVLSAANEGLLKDAMDYHSEAESHHERAMKSHAKAAKCHGMAKDAIGQVLASANPDDEEDDDEGDGTDDPEGDDGNPGGEDPDEDDDEDTRGFQLTPDAVRTAVREGIEGSVKRALATATGKLD